MRRLILLRHAEAAPARGWSSDRERELTPAGVDQARRAGLWLLHHGARPTRIVCSPARRTQDTAAQLTALFPTVEVAHDEAIYEAAAEALAAVVARHSDAETLLLVGHNPGVSELAALLVGAGTHGGAPLPPCGLLDIVLAGVPEPGTGRLQAAWTP